MNSQIVFSAIVAVYNGAETIQRCIDSIVNQTYPYKELIIIDGGSTDRTVDILRANNDKITYWESEKDRGIYHAWNKALDHVKGEWIYFLGSDDYLWKDNVLHCLAEKLAEIPPQIRVIYGQVALVDKQDKITEFIGTPWESVRKLFFECMSISHSGTLHHKTLFLDHGKFDESFRIAGDYDLLLRELKTRDAYFISNVVVVAYQLGGISNTAENILLLSQEDARAQNKNGVFNLSKWLIRKFRRVIYFYLYKLFGVQAANTFHNFYRVLTGRPVRIK